MKKIIFFAALAALGVVVFASCESTRRSTRPYQTQNQIEMRVSPERNGGAPATVQLTINNLKRDAIEFDANYRIERQVGEQWQEVDLGNFAVIAMMYILQPGGSGEYTINLFSDRVNYPEGYYRVVKNISVGRSTAEPYFGYFRIIEPR